MIELENVYKDSGNLTLLYELLAERSPEQSISHKEMPSFDEHRAFVESMPYFRWLMIKNKSYHVGSIYLTHQREVGISIFKRFQRQGYAEQAIRQLMSICPGKFLANINPANAASKALFAKFGAKHIQDTYEFSN